MFALEVEYLTGRAVAAERHARDRAEWPPHPSRLFSALVDGAFQALSADGSSLPDPVRTALEWLEQLAPPGIAAGDARRREVIPVFVPVNDAAAPDVKANKKPSAGQIDDALAVLPDGRGRQPRFFPTAIPDHPIVHFLWPDASADEAAAHRPALEAITAAVTYLGHSSSLVRAAVSDSPPAATYVCDPTGRHTFRVPTKGRLKDLISHHARNARPSPGQYAAYRKVAETGPPPPAVQDSAFGDMIVCQLRGPHLPLTGALKLTRAARDAVIAATDAAPPAVKTLVSGHTPDGGYTREEHVAYVPLANVGFRHSDGKVMGFGVVLPRELGRFSSDRRAIVQAVAGLGNVWFGDSGSGAGGPAYVPAEAADRRYVWEVAIPTEDVPKSLQTWAYTGPAKAWATVTPVLLDRHGEQAEAVVAESVRRLFANPPEITRVEVSSVSWHPGVPPSHQFPNRRKDGDQPRHRLHALVEFKQEVRGLILAGAGRYLGLGLFRGWKPEGRR